MKAVHSRSSDEPIFALPRPRRLWRGCRTRISRFRFSRRGELLIPSEQSHKLRRFRESTVYVFGPLPVVVDPFHVYDSFIVAVTPLAEVFRHMDSQKSVNVSEGRYLEVAGRIPR